MPRILTVIIAAVVLQSAPPVFLPIVSNQLAPTATPTNTPPPLTATATALPMATATPIPTSTPNPVAPCPCEADTLNCSDFATQPEAQACYDYCMATVGRDIHRLDGGAKDGVACENLPPTWGFLTIP